jgi:hypothetical protein
LKWVAPAAGGFPAWTSYTPTVTASSGSITSYTSSGYYSVSGKTCIATGTITITSVGTANATMIATLPFTAQTHSGTVWQGASQEIDATGKSGACNVSSAENFVRMRDYSFATFFGTGAKVCFTIAYEVA